jgi:DNA modification methylase
LLDIQERVELHLENFKWLLMERRDATEHPYLLREFVKHDPEFIIRRLKERPWRVGKYKKQSWGIWLHRMAPYVGRMKPALAHWLILLCSRPNDIILDPFCGIGTVLLEADLLGRMPVGLELNPYALIISKAKFDRRPLRENIRWLKNVKLDLDEIGLESISPYIRQFYHEKTLKELFALKKEIQEENNMFLLGCLLGIVHGHRPQHLSSITGYIVPYNQARHSPTYKNVVLKMIEKVKRMYTNSFPLDSKGEVIRGDAREIPLHDNSVDVVISSPPYYSTIDYVESNKLRLAILGFENEERESLKRKLIQQEKTYIHEMKKVGLEIRRVLKPGSLCVFVLGDFPKSNHVINTAENISQLYSELGFKTHGIIEDEIPTSKRTFLKWAGNEALKLARKKLDRILVMQVQK